METSRILRNSERLETYHSDVTQLTKAVNSKFRESNYSCTSPEKIVIEKNAQHHPFSAFFCICISSVFVTLSSVTIKKITDFNFGQLNLLINIWLTVGNIPILVYTRQSLFSPKKHRFLLFVRAVLSVAIICLNTLAFRLLPVAEVAIIYSLTPGICTIVARIFLKERFGIIQIASLLLTILGILLSARLPELMKNRNVTFTTQYVLGLVCALGYVISCAFAFMLIRLTKDVHFVLQNIYGGVLGLVTFACFAAREGVVLPQCGLDPILMLCVGLFSFIGYSFIVIATQLENVGIVMVVRYSMDVITAVIFQIILFQQYPEKYILSGAAIVLVSTVLAVLSQWLHLQPAESKMKKMFKFLLL